MPRREMRVLRRDTWVPPYKTGAVNRSVGDGVLQWSAAEQMPLGYDVPSARQRCHSEPVTVSLAWESASKKGERIAASLRAAKQVPLGYSSQ